MPLTVTVGASGSGKTTFLDDVHKSHKCTYIRQYHQIRPYLTVTKIPKFDPSELPYWETYVRERKEQSIQVGGTMAGEFTQGLSGGQRKLLLFELIYQRTITQRNLLIVLDEPFAGVTDDFVPFITQRLEEMRNKHNLLVVTNDHVQVLVQMADNTITVSAIDRTKVRVNDHESVDRTLALEAISLGEHKDYQTSSSDLKFFWDMEVRGNKSLIVTMSSMSFFFLIFTVTFWNSAPGSEALVLIAGSLIRYFPIRPYLLSLVDWRNINKEEAEALLHCSVSQNKLMKCMLTIIISLVSSLVLWGCINLVMDGMSDPYIFFATTFDMVSTTFPLLFISLYSTLPIELVQVTGTIPFLSMIFFSTTFSPGAGINGIKIVRYLCPRFYFWCELPGVQDNMEGCPEGRIENMIYLFLSAQLFHTCFFALVFAKHGKEKVDEFKIIEKRKLVMSSEFFGTLQNELLTPMV